MTLLLPRLACRGCHTLLQSTAPSADSDQPQHAHRGFPPSSPMDMITNRGLTAVAKLHRGQCEEAAPGSTLTLALWACALVEVDRATPFLTWCAHCAGRYWLQTARVQPGV